MVKDVLEPDVVPDKEAVEVKILMVMALAAHMVEGDQMLIKAQMAQSVLLAPVQLANSQALA